MNFYFSYQAQLRSPFGVLGIHCADDALVGITFLEPHFPPQAPRDAFAREVCAQLTAYFADANFQFDLPLKLSGTEHQLKVWQALREIHCGQVQTYGELAAALHSSPRAVGQACGNNPIPIVIPCHRVVSKAGLGGFMHRADSGALDIKSWLLAHEKATISDNQLGREAPVGASLLAKSFREQARSYRAAVANEQSGILFHKSTGFRVKPGMTKQK